jgi:hypothetical protein
MLSAVGGENMRGIDRVLAVVLLLGAVGGAAAFARHSGSDSTARTVDLAAPPLQHVTAPGTVVIAPTPAPTRVKPAKVAPALRVTLPQATLQRPVQAVQAQKRVQPAEPKPAPVPVETAPPPIQAPAAPPVPTPPAPPVQAPAPPPVQTPEPPRALALAQPTPVQPDPMPGKDHGHGWGHLKHDDAAPTPETPGQPAADLPAGAPTSDSSGDQAGNGNGDEQGHGSGHDQNGGSEHSGD